MVVSVGGSDSNPLGLTEGMVVQELGWDDDVDQDLRDEVMDLIDADLVEDAVEAVDVVLLWHRDDEDVTDALVDAQRDLSDAGWIWLMTPKIGRVGHVDAAEINEGARTAGMSMTSSVDVSPDWQASRIVRPKGSRR